MPLDIIQISILLYLLTILQHCDCIRNVSLLTFSCQADTVEVPIESKITLNEFTFCGKYNFKFSTTSVMIYIEPHTEILILDFEEKVGVVSLMDVADLFFFPNQTLLPHTWQSICFTSFHGLTKIFLNGLMIFNETISDRIFPGFF